jgi:CzcA family heavy metal efflux pump
MLRAVIRFSVHHATVIVSLALMLMGYASFQMMHAGLDIFPEFSAPRVIIQTEAYGLTSEQTETLVTQKIEKALSGLIGLEALRSESIQGLSIVTAVFRDGSDVYRNRQLVSERLTTINSELPLGAGTPVMVPLSSSSATIMTLGLRSSDRSLMELRDLVDWSMTPRLLAVPGVADVNVFGGEVRQLQIQPRIERLRQYGLSIQDLLEAAQQATGMPGAGFIENANQRIALNVTGLPNTPETLKEIVVTRHEGRHILLGEVAEVTSAPKPSIGAAEIAGEPAIVLMVIGQYGANTLSVSHAVESVLDDFTVLFKQQGIEFFPHLFRPADYIERSLENLSGHLLLGASLVVLVLFAFLYDLRIAMIPTLAIPLSLLGAVVVLISLGVKLNIMVLGGLAIALGEVVDDAIIDTENIFRRLRENRAGTRTRSVLRVVFEASMEVRSSVAYASFIVAIVFIPLLTLGGVAGRLFAPLGYAYIVAILASLLVALTVTPALCYLLIGRRHQNPQGHFDREETPPLIRALQGPYRKILLWAGNNPLKSLWAPLLLSLSLLALIPLLGGDFLPKLREGHYIIHTTSLPGTALNETLREGSRLVKEFLKIDGIDSASQWAGRAERGADTYGSHYSEYEVRLKELSGQDQAKVLEKIRGVLNDFPGMLSEANTFLTERVEETISGYTSPIVINLYGHDLLALDEVALELATVIRGMKGATDVQLRSPPGTPLLDVRLDLPSLASVGIRPLEVAHIIQSALKGQTVGTYYLENRAYDVSVILPPEQREAFPVLQELPIRTPDGQYIELGQLAEFIQSSGRYNILHRQGQRVQTVTANVEGRDLDSFVRELHQKTLKLVHFPEGVTPEFTGAAIAQSEARDRMLLHALLAGVGVLILMGIAIGNTRNLLLTLINLPFSLAGGVGAAFLSGSSLSVGSMVGFVTLFGITIRNTIMLVSHYRHLTEKEGWKWGMETAFHGALQRLPSILMTALVTGLALLPIAIDSDNPGREIMGPMAAVIIGGLVTSTLLSLISLPVLFARFGDFRGKRD